MKAIKKHVFLATCLTAMYFNGCLDGCPLGRLTEGHCPEVGVREGVRLTERERVSYLRDVTCNSGQGAAQVSKKRPPSLLPLAPPLSTLLLFVT